MPVADPAIVDVLDEIVSRLELLLVEDDSVYSTVVDEVVVPSRKQLDEEDNAIPETPKDNQIIVTVGDFNRIEAYNTAGNPCLEGWRVEFRIRLRVMPSEDDSEGVDFKLLRFMRDVRKAISGGATYDHNWGKMDGNALDSRWGETFERVINDGTSQSDGYIMPLLVDMRLTESAL